MSLLLANEAVLVEAISMQKSLSVFSLIFFLVFFFYSNVTLVCGRSDHTKDMELECCIFQPTMSPVRLVTGDIITGK